MAKPTPEQIDRFTWKPGDITITPPVERPPFSCGGLVEKPLQTFSEWMKTDPDPLAAIAGLKPMPKEFAPEPATPSRVKKALRALGLV